MLGIELEQSTQALVTEAINAVFQHHGTTPSPDHHLQATAASPKLSSRIPIDTTGRRCSASLERRFDTSRSRSSG